MNDVLLLAGLLGGLPSATLNRRTVFQGAAAGALSLALRSGTDREASHPARDRKAVIWLTMAGGASPWETFDPKPDAPARFRGPFGSIASAVPTVRVAEHLPRIARRLQRCTLIRSLHHAADPTHDAGMRLLLTGHSEVGQPMLGSVAAATLGFRGGMPPFVVLPDLVRPVERPADRRGLAAAHDANSHPFLAGYRPGASPAQDAPWRAQLTRWTHRAESCGLVRSTERWNSGRPGSDFDWERERPSVRAPFGDSDFGRNCWLATRLVQAGTRLVVVNMATSVFGPGSWDVHGRMPFTTWEAYANDLLPTFDRGFAALVDYLERQGLLDSTLVIATGEMGRTPWINESGGRDHWPGVWSALLAGGGTSGGQVIGASDHAGQPRDRPVPITELVATAALALGLNPDQATPLSDELFGRSASSSAGSRA